MADVGEFFRNLTTTKIRYEILFRHLILFLHENVTAFSTVSHPFKDEHFKTVIKV